MLRKERTHYTYIFEQKDYEALKTWLKANKLSLRKIYKDLGVCYTQLKKVVTGKRTTTPALINKLKKMGVKFPKN